MGNLVICGEHPALCPARGAPIASVFALALHILCRMEQRGCDCARVDYGLDLTWPRGMVNGWSRCCCGIHRGHILRLVEFMKGCSLRLPAPLYPAQP